MAKKKDELDPKDEVINGEVSNENVSVDTNSESFLNFEETIGDEVKSKLRVKPRPELDDLTIQVLEETSLKMIDVSDVDKQGIASQYEYAGCKIPSLHIGFKQLPTKTDPHPRFLDLYITPYAYKKNDGTYLQKSSVIQHYKWEYMKLRHMADAFKDHPNYEKVSIPAFDPCAEVGVRLEQLTAYYAAWAKLFGGKDGKGFPGYKLWVKVVADSMNGTYYTVPDFVNDGFIEKWVEGQAPSIEIKPSDILVLQKSKKAKQAEAAASGKGNTGASGSPDTGSKVDDDVMDLVNKYQ